jgi:RimJ/RimL family protein N-acetyltransferase
MLQINQYGVTLKRVQATDIELIRKWRNHPSIKRTMSYQKNITQAQQKEWFLSINNALNYYFLIQIEGTSIGVINCRNVNLKDQYGEGGIFIWDEKYQGSPYPLFASLSLLDYIFNVLKIGDKSFVRILANNQVAQKYNEFLGYIKTPSQENVKNQWYLLTKETFNKNSEKIRKTARLYTETDGTMIVSGENSACNLPEVNHSIGNQFKF